MDGVSVRIRVKLGVNEVEVEAPAESVGRALEWVPELVKRIPAQEQPGAKPGATPPGQGTDLVAVSARLVKPPPSQGSLPEIRVERDDSLTDIITKIFRDPWGRNPRKLSQVREVLESYGMIYPKQSVAVALLRLAQSGRLRRFKDEGGEFVYVASGVLAAEAGTGAPTLAQSMPTSLDASKA